MNDVCRMDQCCSVVICCLVGFRECCCSRMVAMVMSLWYCVRVTVSRWYGYQIIHSGKPAGTAMLIEHNVDDVMMPGGLLKIVARKSRWEISLGSVARKGRQGCSGYGRLGWVGLLRRYCFSKYFQVWGLSLRKCRFGLCRSMKMDIFHTWLLLWSVVVPTPI